MISETEVYVGFEDFVNGPQWLDSRLGSLGMFFENLCDVGTFVRESCCLKFAMAGIKIKFSVGPLSKRADETATWRRLASDPFVHALSLLVLEAAAADSTMMNSGFTPWVVIGLVAIFLAVCWSEYFRPTHLSSLARGVYD